MSWEVVRKGAVMVEKGPLTYSVAIKPEMRRIKRPKPFDDDMVEKVRFIPMCCTRSHVTVFPTATTNAEHGCQWVRVTESTLRKDRAKPGSI